MACVQINSNDVANSTHERCVQLIRAAGQTLILKVTKPAGHLGAVSQDSAGIVFTNCDVFLFLYTACIDSGKQQLDVCLSVSLCLSVCPIFL